MINTIETMLGAFDEDPERKFNRINSIDSIFTKMNQIFNTKGIIPSFFENTITQYPYDYYIDKSKKDIYEHVFMIPVAGYFKDEIHVNVKNNCLKVELLPTCPFKQKDDIEWVHTGIKKGKVMFEWYVKGITPEKTVTKLNNGMLTITLTVHVKTTDDGYKEVEIK